MRKLGLATAVVCAALAVAPPAFASHSWNGYHWARSANPFGLTFDDHVSSAWKTYLSGAATDWGAKGTVADYYGSYTASSPVTPFVNPNLGTNRKCRPVSGRVETCDAAYGYNGWLGLASVWVSGQHITQGTVKLNDTYYSTGSRYDTPVWRGAVLCQESGHTIGLDHQDTSGANFHTCMDYANSPDGFNAHPNRDDYDELRGGGPSSGFHTDAFGGVVGAAIYTSHFDGASSSSAAASSPTGRLKRLHDDLWVQRLAGGGERFVFVYWKKRGGHYTAPAGA
jgi:hypothetical protein